MKYASVCSGVEAASLAWIPIGWEAAWFSEIEPFPCAVLKERFPNVPNLGDMTKIKIEDVENGTKFIGTGSPDVVVPGGIDLLVGGTPCQDVSVAGKRAGLVEGSRSRLAFDFTRIAYESKAKWIVWENVPGVFSLNQGRDFAAFLSSLAGWDVAVPNAGWKNSGIVRNATDGNFGLVYRVLDAQYVRVDGFPRAIPQRRRRVFVVGYLGEWTRPASVLLESESLSGNTPPCRIKGKGFTADIESRSGESCRPWDNSGVNPTLNQCSSESGIIGSSNQELFSQNMNGIVIGFDSYNQKITGKVAKSCTSYASDYDHVPCVIKKTVSIGNGYTEELSYTQNATGVMGVSSNATVRRLMPVECERLMGFPDNWTRIPWKGKSSEECPDSHRYKACGNSMCVNVMRWIGMRIELNERKHRK